MQVQLSLLIFNCKTIRWYSPSWSLSFLSLKLKKCFHKVSNCEKLDPHMGALPSLLLTKVQLSSMLLHTQKLSDYCVISIKYRHKIAGSTRTVMVSLGQLNSKQLFLINSRSWYMQQPVQCTCNITYTCICV